jgi:predicted Ser/Thr protein kinase
MITAEKIGRYEVTRLLGKGGMGEVYLGRDPFFDREVAIKTIRLDAPGFAGREEEARARFLREAKITGHLQHPHIVVVYEFGQEQSVLFLAMEYIGGGSLSDLLGRRDISFHLHNRLRLAAEVADALAYAHGSGVLHRDVKPANILLTPQGHAKVADFGIGKLLEGDVNLTHTGEMIGSPAYMSPEQMRGEKVDHRSDIFSLGIVLYQLLTGHKPFPAETLTSLVFQVLSQEPPDPLTLNPSIPPNALAVLQRCLSKERDSRYQDCATLAEDLRALVPTASAPTGVTGALDLRQAALASEILEQLPARSDQVTGQLAATHERSETIATAEPAKSDEPAKARAATVAMPAPGAESTVHQPAETRKRPATVAIATVVGAVVLAIVVGVMLTRGRKPQPGSDGRVEGAAPVAEVTANKAVSAGEPAPAGNSSVAAPIAAGAISIEARRGVRLRVRPDQARVFLDDRYVGIAADWSDRNGGSVLYFVIPGEHRLRIAYPGFEDFHALLRFAREAKRETADLVQDLKPGTPAGPTGPGGQLAPPQYKTVRSIRFAVKPGNAMVTIEGTSYGKAASWEDRDLNLQEMGVYNVVLTRGAKRKTVRVMVSLLAGQACATIKEKL